MPSFQGRPIFTRSLTLTGSLTRDDIPALGARVDIAARGTIAKVAYRQKDGLLEEISTLVLDATSFDLFPLEEPTGEQLEIRIAQETAEPAPGTPERPLDGGTELR